MERGVAERKGREGNFLFPSIDYLCTQINNLNAIKMISMVERKDIISAYERTMSMRAVSRELGLSRKTVKKYVMEYLSAKSGGD